MQIIKYESQIDHYKPILVKKEVMIYGDDNFIINNPRKCVDMMNTLCSANRMTEEYVWVIALDTKLKPIGLFEISHGTVNMSWANPRAIFMRLTLCNATSFILIHCHPTGDCCPSQEDEKLTKNLINIGKMMEIPCNDHIVIGANSYYSFKGKKGEYMYEMQIKDLTKMNIQCCDEFTVEGDALCIPYELWFNVDEYFGTNVQDTDDWINFYTYYHKGGKVTASYTVVHDDSESTYALSLSEKEEAFFRGMMQAYCKYNCDCFIDDLWDEIIQDKAQIGAYH